MADDVSTITEGRGRTMTGLWVEDGRVHLRDDIPRPVPPPGWALVAIITAGVCGTDLQILRGYAGFTGVLGHEFVGRVVEGSPEWLDRRVVGEVNIGCGRCDRCLASGGGHCDRRRVLGIRELNGAFAEFLVLPESNLHVVPDSVTDDEAPFVEPLAAVLRIAEQVEIPAGARLLVLGDGRLGQLAARSLHAAGHDVEVAGRHPSKLDRLRRLGIAVVSPGAGAYDLAVECTGSPTGFDAALAALRPEGTLVLKSTCATPLRIDSSDIVVNEIQVVGSRCGPFAPALRALADRSVPVADLVDATYPLEEAEQALEMAVSPDVIKVQIAPKSLQNP